MSWGDHDTEAIRAKLNVDGRLKQEKFKLPSVDQELFFKHQSENNEKNLAYRDRDWFQCGLEEGRKIQTIKHYGYVNNFSKNLKIIRIAAGLTMEELHNQSGIATQTIGKYEKGDTEPTISSVLKLAEGLSVSVAYLIGADLTLEVKEKTAYIDKFKTL